MYPKINAQPYNENSKAKVGDLVTYNGSYFINKTGKNGNPQSSQDWIYDGQIKKTILDIGIAVDGDLEDGVLIPLNDVNVLAFSGQDFDHEVNEATKTLLIKKNESQSFIPLDGTKNEEPVTGPIQSISDVFLRTNNAEFVDDDTMGIVVASKGFVMTDENSASSASYTGDAERPFIVNSPSSTSRGISSDYDYSANVQDLDYIQKKFYTDNLPDLEKAMEKGNITKYKLRFSNNDKANPTAGDFFFNTVTRNYSFGSLRQEATGTDNVGVGFRSLMSLTTGIRNTAIGNNSLELLTTGGANIAIGSYSGSRLTTEIRNTFIGHNSGLTSKGSSNTYFGALSGQGSQTGTNTSSYNTGVGTSALIAINEGTHNSALGFQSLYKLTNGIGNVGIGNYSGLNFTTGTSNIFVGGSSGSACDTGNSNIYIGQSSASKKGSTQVVNSNRNIMIGRTSGGGVYGENNVFIGTGAGFIPGTANLANINNKLIIHNRNPYISGEDIENSITNSENTFETGLITGDFAERWVKINGSFSVNLSYLVDSDLAPNIIDYPFDIVAKTDGTFGRKTRLNLNISDTEIKTGIKNLDGRMIYSRIFNSASDSSVTNVNYTMPGAYEIVGFEKCFMKIPSESSRKYPPNCDYSVQSNWNYYLQDATINIIFKDVAPSGIRDLRGLVLYTKL